MSPRPQFAGIDVSKDSLHVHIAQHLMDNDGPFRVFSFDHKGLSLLKAWLLEHHVQHTVFEASGGYENTLRDFLLEHHLPCTRLQPERARAFAVGIGAIEKTDKLDAKVLARMACVRTQHKEVLRSETQRELVTLMDFRLQLREDLTRLKTQRQKQTNAWIKETQDERIRDLEVRRDALDKRIQTLVDGDQEMSALCELMCQLKGVSCVTAWSLLAYLPELGELNKRELAKLVGVAPMAKESGDFTGKRRCSRGRGKVKACLWMASLSVATHEEPFKQFYQRLKEKGKPPAVARVAVCRKLLTALNAIARDGEAYKPELLMPRSGSLEKVS